jgi:16S rRNA (cytosine967-C5)-methyltransferase
MTVSPRLAAARALLRVEEGGYSQLVFDSEISRAQLCGRDAAFAAAVFYGTLERKLTLDFCMEKYARHALSPAIRTVLRMAFYQLLYMPGVPAHAAVDEAVQLTRALRQPAAAGMVNGILRAFLRDGCRVIEPKGDIAGLRVRYSCPDELAALLVKWYGRARAEQILAASLGGPPVFIRTNTLKTDSETLKAALAAEGIDIRPGPAESCFAASGNLAHTDAYRRGLFWIQDYSSQRAALSVSAKAGERIFDACAAPGAKSFLMAVQMKNDGEILCADVSPARLALVAEGAKRLGISIIRTVQNDAAAKNPALGQFDRVLCDVPCSGLGVLRRKPEIKYRPVSSYQDLPEIQYKILQTSSHYCKAGGILVYSTCTLNPEENERVVERFLAGAPGFSPAEEDGHAAQETVFPDEAGGDGFFIARIRRNP